MHSQKNLSRSSSTSSINSTASAKRKAEEMDDSEMTANKETKKPAKVTTAMLYEMLEGIKVDTAQIPNIITRFESTESNVNALQNANAANDLAIKKVNERIDNIGNVKLNEQIVSDSEYCKSILKITVCEVNKNLIRSNNNSSVIKDVIISGFPYINLKREQLFELALIVFHALKVKIEQAQITDAFYLLKKIDEVGTDDDISDKEPRVPFVVKLNNATIVKKIISAKRRYKKLEFSKLNSDNAVIAQFKNMNNFTIFVNESLSKYHYKLLKLASKKLKEENNFQKVWQSNGFIYAQFQEALPLHLISSEYDIEKLLSLYPKEK